MERNDAYFAGTELRGEDFTDSQLEQWYREEEHSYKDLGYSDEVRYPYHALNTMCGFNRLPKGQLGHIVGIGSAHGKEFIPIINRITQLTIVESDRRYWTDHIGNAACVYLAPNSGGTLPMRNESVDVVTCFGVLHHIAKVSATITEIARILKPAGHALFREPIISMGDWRKLRKGLTKNERGIPNNLFDQMLSVAGFEVVSRRLVGFVPLLKLAGLVGINLWSLRATTLLDIGFSNLYQDVRYHRVTPLQKIAPNNVFYVVRKVVSAGP